MGIVPPDMERKCEARARKARVWLERVDALPLLERRLLAYFGDRRAGEGLSKRNPGDVAAYLGDKAGFEAYCAQADAALPKPAAVTDAAAAWAAFNGGR